jgi:cytochrome c oxidase subunit 2
MRRLALSPKLRRLLRSAGPVLLIALLAGCMIPPEPETKEAEATFLNYNIIFGMGVFVFLAVEGFIVYAIFRYRRRDDTLPHQLHGNTIAEILWTAIPTVIVLILFVINIATLNTVNAVSENPGVTVEVDGFQWQWGFHYIDGDNNPDNDVSLIGTPGDLPVLRLPVGEPVHLTLLSKDVIHSFYVPHFLIKKDLIPEPEGQAENQLEFTITDAGTYAGQCAEFCGNEHAAMRFTTQAMEQADYDTWIAAGRAGESPPPPAPSGAAVVDLAAANIAFGTDSLQVPAGQPFVIRFKNDDSVQHDVAIFNGQTELFNGDTVDGGATIEYSVPALPAGEYDFLCTIHPTMSGKVVAQ